VRPPRTQFDSAYTILRKVLGNILASPDEAKYRQLRITNQKVATMLMTKGVRALLVGSGFVEGGDFLTLPADADVEGVRAACAALEAQAADRAAADSERRSAEVAKRKENADQENEERKRMMMGIDDDASARKEPGWTAKAAGVKGGRAITSCADVGIGQGGG